jgi:hypothetical protein
MSQALSRPEAAGLLSADELEPTMLLAHVVGVA